MTRRSPLTSQESARMSGRWERSVFVASDLDALVADGLVMEGTTRVPGDEEVPVPLPDERVCFQSFFPHGFALPLHTFFRGLLFAYQLQLHDLTPNGVLHILALLPSVSASWESILIGGSG